MLNQLLPLWFCDVYSTNKYASPLFIGSYLDRAKPAAHGIDLIENGRTVDKAGVISLAVLTQLYWVLSNLHSLIGPEWLDPVDDLLASQRMHLE
jgi:hypothetical protein